jgi:hypothetical protein
MIKTNKKPKKFRLGLVISEEAMGRIEKAASYFSIPKAAFIMQATIEKLEKFEQRYERKKDDE